MWWSPAGSTQRLIRVQAHTHRSHPPRRTVGGMSVTLVYGGFSLRSLHRPLGGVDSMFVPRCLAVGYAGVVREIRWTVESEAHIARHDVAPEEVEQVVNSRPRYEARGREDSTLLYGATDAGRALLVVLVEAVDGRWYVATAREMTDTERRTFRRKGR